MSKTYELVRDLSNSIGIIEGYAALNFEPYGWKGVIAGNHYCKNYRVTSAEALQDAKEMFDHCNITSANESV